MMESIFDSEVLNSRYFFPRQQTFSDPFWVESEGERLSCFYYNQQDAAARTILFFHGNGEIVVDYIDFLPPIFDQMGFNCLLAEYRGYGMSSGRPALVAMLKDVENIVDALKLPHGQLILFGRSIGSIYAIHGAYKFPDICGLIVESGVADLLDRILLRVQPEELGVSTQRMRDEVALHLDPQKKLANFQGASLIMHAKGDSLLNVSHGRKLFEWAPQPKQLKIFERGDHNDIFYANSEQYLIELASFFQSLPTNTGHQ